jgi:uncharacterized protein YndB with AHSA1/START domain
VIRAGRILQEVVLPVDRETLFGCFTDAGRLASWMGSGGSIRTYTESTLAMTSDSLAAAAQPPLPGGAQVEPWPGGVFRCALPGGQEWDGLVVEVSSPNRLVVTLGWRDPALGLPPGMSLVEWDFLLHARGTRLRMRHEHVPPDLLVLHNDAWGRLYARLRNRLLGRAPGPHPLEDLAERLAQLAGEGEMYGP